MKSNRRTTPSKRAPNPAPPTASEGVKRGGLIKSLLKVGIGIALVYYVVRSGMIDFKLLGEHLFNPWNAAIGAAFFFLSWLCVSFRWYLLARKLGLTLSYKSMFELTMIGNFFNTFMPGSVGGDLIKAWYIAGREPQKRTRAIFSVLVDRVIGLSVIIFYAAAALALFPDRIALRPELRLAAYALWGFTGASLLGAAIFFSPLGKRLFGHGIPSFLKPLTDRVSFVHKIVDAALVYRNHFGTVSMAVALSAISMLGMNFFYKIQGDALGIQMDVSQYFFIVPMALVASAVPILPGGIGVGQVAFFTLFQWAGIPNPEMGGSLCTAVQIYTILFSCLGAISYVRFRRHPEQVV